jgi:SAM-dependent methyltransferase
MADTQRTDRRWLLEEQYTTDDNLRSRIELHRRFSTGAQSFHRWVFDRLDVPADSTILELGAGRAELWRENADRIPPGWRLTITDLSPGMVEAARSSGVEAEFTVVDAQEIPFANESFDVVIANHMLYHVPDRPRALAEISRVLAPGGLLVATTVGDDHLLEVKELARRHAPAYVWEGNAARFGIGTGREQLEAFFADVRLETHPDSLEVTDAAAVVAFVQSLSGADTADIAAIAAEVEQAIERDGAFRVRKSGGLFRCRKP